MGQHEGTAFGVDAQPGQGMDDAQRIGAGFHHSARNAPDAGHVGRQLDDDRNARAVQSGLDMTGDFGCGVWAAGVGLAEIAVHVGAGDIDFEQVGLRSGDGCGDYAELLRRTGEDAGDQSWPMLLHLRLGF